MGSQYLLTCVCFWLPLVSFTISVASQKSTAGPGNVIEGNVFINGTTSIGRIDDDFVCATLDWWPPEKCDYGTCSWGRDSLLNLDLNNLKFLNAIKAFSPLKIRLGGTLQDKVIYERAGNGQPCSPFVKNNSEFLGFSQGCLPMSRWDELSVFFKKAGAVVVFGLNELSGKTTDSQGSAVGAWNSSNAESLIRYTVNKGYNIIHGWELGNELSGNGIGARVSADQYASDINSLQNVVQNIYAGFKVKPQIVAPGGFFDATWFTDFIKKTPKSLQVVSHHIYNLGPGVDDHLIEKILDPSSLDSTSQTFSSLQSILKNSGTQAVAWVGEAGGAYNSGHNLVTNAFVFSFWYLDQLGMASSFDTKTYCRQTLVGGNYGLLNTSTFAPNPDYYSALLWHRLMGNKVLSTRFSGTNKIRAYAHCSKKTKGITLLLINLDGNTTVQVRVSTENNSGGTKNSSMHEIQIPRTRFATMHRVRGSKRVNDTRKEYHLTAKDGDLHSQTILLNGKILNIDSSGLIPPLIPIDVNQLDPIIVVPFSIVFAQIPYIKFSACN
ncbi:heparanase-like protein 3 [Quercus suber]|uniref:heparanase-like protein 3 n=1 Tax=Quercus suber TaxID=58331 RepID=UPI000CE1970A|nr:heparanase-like protein 3 isoform X1 [Quercus suber]